MINLYNVLSMHRNELVTVQRIAGWSLASAGVYVCMCARGWEYGSLTPGP
jgi:hypothetical protein